jgi:hypothetical protein
MESGENQLHKSSLESQCKSPVSTDHRNWIVVPSDPTKSVTTINLGIPLQYPAMEFRRKEITCLIEEKPCAQPRFHASL